MFCTWNQIKQKEINNTPANQQILIKNGRYTNPVEKNSNFQKGYFIVIRMNKYLFCFVYIYFT